MLTLRARIFIIVSVGVLIILGISIFLLTRSRLGEPLPAAPAGEAPIAAGTSITLPPGNTAGPAVAPISATARAQQQARQTAKLFVERYATYSTENNFQNIIELEPLVTLALWTRLRVRLSSPIGASPFVGVTTRGLSANVSTLDMAAATVVVRAIRTTEKNGVITNSQHEYTVALKKIASLWLVDSFTVLPP